MRQVARASGPSRPVPSPCGPLMAPAPDKSDAVPDLPKVVRAERVGGEIALAIDPEALCAVLGVDNPNVANRLLSQLVNVIQPDPRKPVDAASIDQALALMPHSNRCVGRRTPTRRRQDARCINRWLSRGCALSRNSVTAQPDPFAALPRCGAKTRRGTLCKRVGSSRNGRCHLHGARAGHLRANAMAIGDMVTRRKRPKRSDG